MKSQMKPAIVALTLTLGLCLLFPSVARAQEGKPCDPEPTDMFIGYGDLITCAIDVAGDVDIFRFNGIAGQRIEIVASSGVTYPCIELVGVTSACGNYATRNWIDTVLTKTQEYTIRVYDWSSSGAGTYTLDLESVVPPSPNARQTTYGKYLTDQINPAGDLDVFFFTASVGDVVDITANSTSTYPCIALYAPDAKTVGSLRLTTATAMRSGPALPLAGTYTILVYDCSNSAGGYTLDLECLSGPCPVTQIPDVSGYITLRGTPLAGAGVSLTQPGAPGPQLTMTDGNGYYQFLHIISGQTFNVLIHGPASDDSSKPVSGGAASAGPGEVPFR